MVLASYKMLSFTAFLLLYGATLNVGDSAILNLKMKLGSERLSYPLHYTADEW